MSFFTSSDVTLGAKLLEIIYMVCGLICIYTGIKNARDEKNPSRLGTALFWLILGVVLAFGRFIPPMADGVLIIIMTLPAIFRKVKIGETNEPAKEYTQKIFDRIGMKIFIPALPSVSALSCSPSSCRSLERWSASAAVSSFP